jgi:hypothetical protein
MKNNNRRLQALLKIFGYGAFYSCEITSSMLYCMVKFNAETLSKATCTRIS